MKDKPLMNTPGKSITHYTPDMAFQRSLVYELLSHAFGEPSQDLLDFIKNGEFIHYIKDAISGHLCNNGMDIRPLEEAIKFVMDSTMDDLISEYWRITSPERNLLYEGNYHSPFSVYDEMADVAGF